MVSIDTSPYLDEGSVGRDKLYRRDRGGENALGIPRTMSSGGASPGNGDVWDRGGIRQCEAGLMQFSRQLGVTQA